MDKQKDVRKHIAAAKGWLNKADDSLEQENDIQGDLKLMLAHAELQRAQEKNDQKLCVRWFKRLAPPVVACILVLAGILYMQAGKNLQEPQVQKLVETAGESAAGQITLPQTVEEKPDAQGIWLVNEAKNDEEAANSYEAADNHIDYDTDNEDNYNDNIPGQSQQELKVPDKELQKLMQSAGSVLRE